MTINLTQVEIKKAIIAFIDGEFGTTSCECAGVHLSINGEPSDHFLIEAEVEVPE